MQNRDKSLSMFAVMGATGTGKSTFIKLLTNDENIRVGHSQESETFDIETSTYVDQATGRSIMFIDTPGFDDSREGITDTDILQKIVEYLEPEGGQGHKLNGVIYLHRISDPRVGGVSRKNLRMFYSLCGEENLRNVRIVTTNWGRVGEEEGARRELDLKNGAFKPLVDAGAQMRRHMNTLESARQIMAELIPLEAVTMKIQEELRDGKKLADTEAGQVLTAEMRAMQARHEREMVNLRKEMEMAAKAHDLALRAELAEERRALEGRIARVEADRAALERTLEEQREAQESRRQEEVARLAKLMEQLAEERRESRAQVDRAHKSEMEFRNRTADRQRELEGQIAAANKRMAELSSRKSGGGCIIC